MLLAHGCAFAKRNQTHVHVYGCWCIHTGSGKKTDCVRFLLFVLWVIIILYRVLTVATSSRPAGEDKYLTALKRAWRPVCSFALRLTTRGTDWRHLLGKRTSVFALDSEMTNLPFLLYITWPKYPCPTKSTTIFFLESNMKCEILKRM